jgi:phosphate transport system protein
VSSAHPPRIDADSQYAGILERTVRAYTAAQTGAARVADCLASRAEACAHAVQMAEEELDRLDREVDVSVTAAIIEVTPLQARELLSAMKMVLDLERIGDLFASVASCACALGLRLATEDVSDLVKMATLIERMLGDAHGAFAVRNVDRAMAVLRADSEVDRLRNLLILRRLERVESEGVQNSLQVVSMAQALERAGDHVKNLAEEVCHLATGHTLRHMLGVASKPDEQMYLEHLRIRDHIDQPAVAMDENRLAR